MRALCGSYYASFMDEKSWNWSLFSRSASRVYSVKHESGDMNDLKWQKSSHSQDPVLVLQVESICSLRARVGPPQAVGKGKGEGDFFCSEGGMRVPQAPRLPGSWSLSVEKSALCVGPWCVQVRERVVW